MADIDHLFRTASELHRQGRLADAGELYRKILTDAPAFHPALNMLGILTAQQGDPATAIDCFNRAIAAAPNDPVPRENLGKAWLNMHRLENAQAAYNDALSINPASYAALYGLGCSLHAQGKYAEALAVFTRARAINATDPTLFLYLGAASQHLERREEASACYKQALALDPASIDANVCLANLLVLQKDFPAAERYFVRALDLGARRTDVEFGYAQTLEHRGDETAAREHYFRAVELDPASQNAYIQLDQFLLKSGGREKQALLEELAGDYIYADWDESLNDMRRLAALVDYPDRGATQALHAFMERYRPGELYDRHWWRKQLDAFGGINNGHDKLLRSLHSAVYCWSLPDRQTLAEVAAFVSGTRLCSYGSGSGVWERLLQQHFDIDVYASDIRLRHRFLPMVQADYSSAEVNPADSIFLAWIIRGDQGVLNVLRQMHPGQRLVLIGEPPDREGVPRICATPEMWSLLARDFNLVKSIPLVSYSLLNDTVSLFVRKMGQHRKAR
jgi:Flp pilus assembly protein TadD